MRPLRILYVEDSMICREIVRTVLTAQGHAVRCVMDGWAGVRELETPDAFYDVVITDHDMPGLSGLGLAEYLNKIAYTGGVLVHSGTLTAELIGDYRKLGICHFLRKPTNATELVNAVTASVSEV
jgi:DNA-binding NtrC family response regulator